MISVRTIKKEGTFAVYHAVTQFPHCLKVTKDLKTDAYHMKSNNLLLYLLPIENYYGHASVFPTYLALNIMVI
jgi:hypothetical protein